MTKHRRTDMVCIIVAVFMVFATVLFMFGDSLGIAYAGRVPEYVKLFDTSLVHSIDIQVSQDDWDAMIANAANEEYIQVTVVVDGEKFPGVGIRPKGNSSLSMIERSDSDRYSFKIEFDRYSNSISYHGLDKLALNNIAQDNTYMKDYVSYQMMNAMGADAPLSSFVNVTLNGADWGLYLAVEGVEEAFAARVYGNDYGEIYKPDSMDMGGGMGGEREMPDFGNMPDFENGEMPGRGNFGANRDFENMPEGGGFAGRGGGGFGGMSAGATTLKYTDDDPASYSAIFDNAAFKTSNADKARLIESLKKLNAGEDIGSVVDTDEVIRYFVVHNFVLNSDSYTGNLVHNYYLAEKGGKLSMIAWDYNLAFGGMGGGGDASSLVNYSVDEPLLSGSMEDRPMLAWIFSDEEYLAQYKTVYAEYMEYFSSGAFAAMYDNAVALISPYVEKDPSAFCTYEEFLKGSAALREFCLLRAEAITRQLGGDDTPVDASGVDVSSMGSNSMGFDRARNFVRR